VSLLKSAVDEWAIEDLETLSDDELADQLVDLDTVIDQLELQRARRLDRLNRRKSFAGDGYSSATAFLIHRCKIPPDEPPGWSPRRRHCQRCQGLCASGAMSGCQPTRSAI
jgi:hypothetical protein